MRKPLPPETPDEIERKRANLAKLTAPDVALAERIRRIVEACKRDMPKPDELYRHDEVIG